MLSLKNIKKIYFIGIGGIGMSAVAGIAAQRGFSVCGSDSSKIYAPAKTVLDKKKIKYRVPYQIKNIERSAPDLVVVGGGETNENPEVAYAVDRKIQITSFPELLSSLLKHNKRIVVCGTHGKTTTTSLIALLLQKSGKNPGYFIGGLVQDFSSNHHYDPQGPFVIEGDEYFSSFFDRQPKFFHYRPDILVVNNIEMDHFDFFHSKEELLDVFRKLIAGIPGSANIFANADDENVRNVLSCAKRKIVWLSTESEDHSWYARFLEYKDRCMLFDVFKEGERFDTFSFTKPGVHYMKNALGAIAVADSFGCTPKQIKKTLSFFLGTKRRFELIGEVAGVTIIDDYAHHPTAVLYTLDAAKKMYPDSRLWAVYEPHTFSRTKHTLSALARSFAAADEVIVADIYPAREQHLANLISSQEVIDAVKKCHRSVHHLANKKKALEYLLKNVQAKDVVVTMAVGSFNEIAYDLRDALSARVP